MLIPEPYMVPACEITFLCSSCMLGWEDCAFPRLAWTPCCWRERLSWQHWVWWRLCPSPERSWFSLDECSSKAGYQGTKWWTEMSLKKKQLYRVSLFVEKPSASEREVMLWGRGWIPDHTRALDSHQLGWASPELLSTERQLLLLRGWLSFLKMLTAYLGWFPLSCAPGDRMVAHLWSFSICLCRALALPMWGDTVNTSEVFWAAYYCQKLQLLLMRLLLSTSIPILPFRMGLEALVESYAFWRPSLRTLTFEDIPGIPKQGKTQSLWGQDAGGSWLEAQMLKNTLDVIDFHNGDLITNILLLWDPSLFCEEWGWGPEKWLLWS